MCGAGHLFIIFLHAPVCELFLMTDKGVEQQVYFCIGRHWLL